MHIIPAPSPSGRNAEKLFVFRSRGGPTHALDSLPPSKEQKQDQRAGLLEKCVQHILLNATPEERAQIVDLLTHEDSSEAMRRMENHKAREAATDRENLPLGAQTNALGAQNYPGRANDSASASYAKRFPLAGRLG